MSSSHGNHFRALPNSGPCRLSEASLAVLSKPSLSIKSASAGTGALVFATLHFNARDVFVAQSRLISSDGPPPGIHASTLTNPVLRI
jgi:hypothetical protein